MFSMYARGVTGKGGGRELFEVVIRVRMFMVFACFVFGVYLSVALI